MTKFWHEQYSNGQMIVDRAANLNSKIQKKTIHSLFIYFSFVLVHDE